ncbi:Mbov_0397 family ICE element conjugal transfer ATPase [Mycoplasma sp. 3686d]|uniref:Mbov_0397 family ICE element conjugal transfer ATPase n=1 Tax=Mycoplasma sp. 3686d TaxID=2967300 RepID=UPI00211C4D42|nr:ATP-binding protein [Mycoplasma sp. 3686d]UUM24651.1 ATP-binding protein [Mycoplasma sp. 3686d]
MKLQTDKLKKYKQLKLFKNLTPVDCLLIFLIGLLTASIAFISTNILLIRLVIFVFLCLISSTLFMTMKSRGVRTYVWVYWVIKHILRVKKYKTSGAFNTKNLNTLQKLEGKYFNLLSKGNFLKSNFTTWGMVLEVFGKDISTNNYQEQDLYLDSLTETLNSIETKIFIVKIPTFLNTKDNLGLEKVKDNQVFAKLKKDWENDLNAAGNYQKIDKYYIVVLNKDKQELYNQVMQIQSGLAKAELESVILENRSLLNFLNDLYLFGNDLNEQAIKDILQTGDLAKYFTYDNVYFKNKYFITQGRDSHVYNSVQTISAFPLKLNQNWIQETFNSSSVVVWSLNPLDSAKKDKVLNTAEINLEVNSENIFNRSFRRKQRNNQEALENVSEAVSWNTQQLFESSLMLWNRAFDLETLKEQEQENILNIKKWKGLNNNLHFRQIEAYSSILFKQTDMLNEYTEQLSENIGSGWVFHNQYINDQIFSIIGNALFNKNIPVFFDPSIKNAKRVNQNMFVLGTSGSGKSTFCKKLLVPRVAMNDKVIILDPQGEYKSSMSALGGRVIKMGVAEDLRFNPLQIIKLFNPRQEDSKQEQKITNSNEQILTLNEDFIREWFMLLYPEFTATHIKIIVIALKKVWARFGFLKAQDDITKRDNNTYPLVSDLIEELRKIRKEDLFFDNAIEILTALELDFLDNGRFHKLYNQYTNIDLSDNLIVFDTSSLMHQKKEVKNSSFYLIISFIKGIISDTYKKDYRVWLMIDEAHKFIDANSLSTLDFIYQTVKEGRKYNCGTIITTQNPQDFTKTDDIKQKGQAILENCQYAVFLKLTPGSTSAVDTLFEAAGGLSETEKHFLIHAKVGEGILALNSKTRIAIDTYYNDTEKELFFESGDLRKYE